MHKTKKIVLSGLLTALGVLIPIVFHMFHLGGQIFLPMHIPVILAGFLVGPVMAALVGILTPLLSSLLTGMPPLFPMAVIMIFELGTYGFTAAVVYKKAKNIFVALIASLAAGRAAAGLTVAVLLYIFEVSSIKVLNPIVYIQGSITTGIPGIIIQLILIPAIVILLRKSKVMEDILNAAS